MLARLLAGALTGLVLVRLGGLERGMVLTGLMGALPLVLLLAHPVLLLALLRRQRVLTLLGVGLVVTHALVVTPALGKADLPPGAADAPRLRVVTANLYVLNPVPEAAGRALRETRPDVLVVPELSPESRAGLEASGLLDDLPYAAFALVGRETVGMFSRLPYTDVSLRRYGGRVMPRATISVGGHDVRLLAAHPLPPIAAFDEVWRRSLASLAAESRAERLPTVLAGDLNGDRDHAAFRELLDTGLRDAHDERGRGLARTWPERFPLLHLDHVLVRDGAGARLAVLEVHETPIPGSDHLAVVADLAVLPG